MSHRHDHDHDPLEDGPALRTRALEELLVAKGLVDPAALDRIVEYYERETGPRNGARVVARAWCDDAFRARLAYTPSDRAVSSRNAEAMRVVNVESASCSPCTALRSSSAAAGTPACSSPSSSQRVTCASQPSASKRRPSPAMPPRAPPAPTVVNPQRTRPSSTLALWVVALGAALTGVRRIVRLLGRLKAA